MKLVNIIACLLFGVLTILFLYRMSEKANHRANGFIRLFPPHVVRLEKILDIRYNSYYIGGVSYHNIYLGNYTTPDRILRLDYSLLYAKSIRLIFQDTFRLKPGNAVLRLDSPSIYLMAGGTPLILSGKLPTNLMSSIPVKRIFFTGSVPLSPSSFVLRVFDSHLNKNMFAKVAIDSPNIRIVPDILDKYGKGIFDTDGMLCCEPNTKKILYIYYYRNEFLYLDSNLTLLYKKRTIDTVTQPQIKIATIVSEGKTTFSAPPMYVNRRACIYGNRIFINSALLANNEIAQTFLNSSVIDVYSSIDGLYRFSFYLPDYFSKKISDFYVYDKTLIAIHDHFILTYALNL